MSICGLDFGTSNTTIGTIEGHAPVLAALETGHTTIPSAIFYEVDGAVLIGRRAVEAYVDGMPGRLMRSLKSVLGTSLIDETTRLGRERTSFRDVIAYYLGAVKRRAEQATGRELRDVVHGRPVHFVDNADDADRKAEQTLREIAREIGFDDVTFQFEPIAAALDYERQISAEEIALTADILANDGVRIGGTDFDRQLSLGVIMPLFGFGSAMKRAGLDVPSRYFHELATWSNINRMYEPRVMAELRQVRQEASEPALLDRLVRVVDEQRGHTLAMEVEEAKIALSDRRQADIPLEWVAPGLRAAIGRPDLVSHTRQLADRIAARIKICLAQARLSAHDIDAVFLTGGSVRLAHVRKAITKAVPSVRIVSDQWIVDAHGLGIPTDFINMWSAGWLPAISRGGSRLGCQRFALGIVLRESAHIKLCKLKQVRRLDIITRLHRVRLHVEPLVSGETLHNGLGIVVGALSHRVFDDAVGHVHHFVHGSNGGVTPHRRRQRPTNRRPDLTGDAEWVFDADFPRTARAVGAHQLEYRGVFLPIEGCFDRS